MKPHPEHHRNKNETHQQPLLEEAIVRSGRKSSFVNRMQFLFIFIIFEIFAIRNCYYVSFQRIKRSQKKYQEIENDTSKSLPDEQHISDFTNPRTGINPFIDLIEDVPVIDGRQVPSSEENSILRNIQENMDYQEEFLPDTNITITVQTKVSFGKQNNSMDFKTDYENPSHKFELENVQNDYQIMHTEDVIVLTSTASPYQNVNVTRSVLNTVLSPSTELYLIIATSVVFFVAFVIIVFGIWKWRCLGRQRNININDKQNERYT